MPELPDRAGRRDRSRRRCWTGVLGLLLGVWSWGSDRAQGADAAAPGTPAASLSASRELPAAQRQTGEIEIDGVLAEPVWQTLPAVRDLVRIAPVEGGRGFGDVHIRVFHSDSALYVGARVFQPPGLLRAHVSPRDQLGSDDTVNIYLNTFPGTDRGYLFRVNALGVQRDTLSLDGQNDASWDAVWDSAGVPLSDGYSVEVRIPFRSLRFGSAPVQEWGLGLSIFTGGRSQLDFWPAVTADKGSEFLQLARLPGVQAARSGGGVDLIPTIAVRASRVQEDAVTVSRWEERPAFSGRRPGIADPGLDVRFGVNAGIVASATVNPDFSQIEADPDQLDYNLRYPLLLPEKRPFFLEGADHFQTPVPLFYSRGINDPVAGVKLTGTAGRLSIGLLSVWDQDPPDSRVRLDPSRQRRPETVLDKGQGKDVGTMAARLALRLGGSRVGMFVGVKQTYHRDRSILGGSHEVVSADARLQLAESTYLTTQLGTTRTALAGGGGVLRGGFSFVNLKREGRRLALEAEAAYYAEDARVETSAWSRVGYTPLRLLGAYKLEINRPWLLYLRPELSVGAAFDALGGRDQYIRPGLRAQLTGDTLVAAGWSWGQELFNGRPHRVPFGTLSLESVPWHWLGFRSELGGGARINYDPDDTFVGRAFDASAALSLWPTRFSQVELLYTKSFFWPDPQSAAPIEDVNLGRLKLEYYLGPRWSVRGIGQLNTFRERLATSLLLAYQHRAGTSFFLGVQSDDSYGPRPDPTVDPQWRKSNRQAFVKLSYLLAL